MKKDEEIGANRALIDETIQRARTFSCGDDDSSVFEYNNSSCLRRWFGPIRGGSLRGSTLAMASITFGGGCLAFPYAVRITGPVVALFIFIICGLTSLYTMWILLGAGIKTNNMDYNNLIEKTMSKKMVVFYDINNMILCIGVIMSYQLSVYGFARDLLDRFFGVDPNSQINKFIIQSICFVVIQMPLSMLKNISTLQYASITGTVALVYSILVIVIEMPLYLKDYLDKGNSPVWFQPMSWDYLDTFATFMFGFNAHNGIFQVFHELKRPSEERYHKVVLRSFIIEIVLYISIAYGGYFSTFLETPRVFLLRPNLFDDYFIYVAKITLFICLHCCMAINYNIMRSSIKCMWFNDKDISFFKDFLITIVTYIFCNIVVFYVEDIVSILGIIGGFSTIVICFINPILIHIKTSGKPFKEPNNLYSLVLMGIMTVVGTMATIKSVISIINSLIKT